MNKRSRGTWGVALAVTAGLLFSVASEAVYAADSSSNKNAPYLRVGAGARALGMGGAFVGVSNDATAAYWNPAGLTFTPEGRWEITGMYTAGLNVDRKHNYLGVSRNSDWGAYALQWINAGTDKIQGYNADGTPSSEFDFNDNALSASFAKKFDIFSAGVTAKYLTESVGATVNDDNANGWGIDLGAGLDLTEWVRFGLSVQNIAGRLGSVDKVNEIPATLRAGLAFWPLEGLTLSGDFEKTRDEEDPLWHFGGEYAFPLGDDLGAALRMGINDGNFAGGVGFSFNFLRFDYAYVLEPQEFLQENHRLGLSLVFGDDEMRAYSGRRSSSDHDGDGIPDNADACPDAGEDFDGFADTDGCPDPDNDGDGILDVNDDCPNQAEDFDGFQDSDGCPDPDNDGDGVLDINDKCPDSAEIFNNFEDADGCPDTAPNAIPTLAYINFKFGTAEISGADPIPVLEEVARLMKERPEMRVKVTGHTDAIGSDESNMALSVRRSEAVRDYLVGRGISADRFVVEGQGENQPVDSNDTDMGRSRNRRIEFSVVQEG